MKTTLHFLLVVILLFQFSCSTPEQATRSLSEEENYICWSARGGINTGGFVDNEVPDAVSGATLTNFTLGIHPDITTSGKTFETGLDLIGYRQNFEYDDPANEYFGKRSFDYYELRLPLTYNFRFFKNLSNCDFFYLKIGISTGYIINKNVTEQGILPAYDLKPFSIGPALGVAFSPLGISRRFKLGVFIDLYRGSKVYKDFYNNSRENGNTTYLSAGLLLKIGPGNK